MDQRPLTSPLRAIAPLDHAMLIAGAAVRQAGTYTARLAERLRLPRAEGDMRDTLVAMFARADFRAAAALRGSFHPHVAQAAESGAASTFMKTGFTVAF